MHKDCPWCHLTLEDELIARAILAQPDDCGHDKLRAPDLVIAPDGKPYIFRWYMKPRNVGNCNQYFHIQVGDDPERPLHDHPWDNMSVIVSGGYDELWQREPPFDPVIMRKVRKGDVIFRRGHEAHRLTLPSDIEYAMTVFSTGPKVREWGFWYPDGWRHYKEVTRIKDGISTHVEGSDAQSRRDQ